MTMTDLTNDPCTSLNCKEWAWCERYDSRATPTEISDKRSSVLMAPEEPCLFFFAKP